LLLGNCLLGIKNSIQQSARQCFIPTFYFFYLVLFRFDCFSFSYYFSFVQSHGQPMKQECGFSAVLCDDSGASPDFLHQFNGLLAL